MWSVALVCTIHRDHCQVVLVNFLWLLVVLVRRAEKVASHLWPPSQNLSKWQVLTNVETQYKAMSKREAWSWHLSPTLQRLMQVTGGAVLPSLPHHCPPTPPVSAQSMIGSWSKYESTLRKPPGQLGIHQSFPTCLLRSHRLLSRRSPRSTSGSYYFNGPQLGQAVSSSTLLPLI